MSFLLYLYVTKHAVPEATFLPFCESIVYVYQLPTKLKTKNMERPPPLFILSTKTPQKTTQLLNVKNKDYEITIHLILICPYHRLLSNGKYPMGFSS